MAYGIEIRNSSSKVIIDSTWPNPQVVESSTYNTVNRGVTYPSTGINTTDVVVARPIRTTQSLLWVGYAGRSIFGTLSQTWGNANGNQPYAASYAYYRLREGQSTSTSGYGIVVYESDGTTPIFNSNGVGIHYEIAALYRESLSSNMSWFNIPSGDDINDYFCVINGKKQVYYLDGFFGELVFHNHYIYDYTNNRIGAASYETTTSGVFYQGNGVIGKIL